jgi:hypothetical protein
MAEKKKKLGAQETKKLIPVFEQFNKLAKVFIKSLNKRIEQKENNIKKINVMLSGGKLPTQPGPNISIQTVDIGQTKVKEKGKYSFNRKMDWEQDINKKNKGIIL